jgi:hypothetical protein
MRQPSERVAVPGDEKVERRLVDWSLGRSRLGQEVALGALAFAIPSILASQRPDRAGRSLRSYGGNWVTGVRKAA